MELKGLKVNVLGDSITEKYNASAPEFIYHGVLKEMAGFSEVRNYGISGTRYAIQQVIGSGDYAFVDLNSFSERFDKMDDDADLILVFGGTNDYGHGDAPIGKFSDRDPHTFYGACHYLYSGLIKKYLGKKIVILTPTHRVGELEKSKDARVKEDNTLLDYVNAIREVAEYYSLPVCDLFKNSGIQPEIPEVREAFMPDGLHPNDAGHRKIAECIYSYLKTL